MLRFVHCIVTLHCYIVLCISHHRASCVSSSWCTFATSPETYFPCYYHPGNVTGTVCSLVPKEVYRFHFFGYIREHALFCNYTDTHVNCTL